MTAINQASFSLGIMIYFHNIKRFGTNSKAQRERKKNLQPQLTFRNQNGVNRTGLKNMKSLRNKCFYSTRICKMNFKKRAHGRAKSTSCFLRLQKYMGVEEQEMNGSIWLNTLEQELTLKSKCMHTNTLFDSKQVHLLCYAPLKKK